MMAKPSCTPSSIWPAIKSRVEVLPKAVVTTIGDKQIEVVREFDGAARQRGLREGFEAAFRDTFKEVVANERLVYTEIFEAQPQEEVLTTVTFDEQRSPPASSSITSRRRGSI
jgi:hypothetical protein